MLSGRERKGKRAASVGKGLRRVNSVRQSTQFGGPSFLAILTQWTSIMVRELVDDFFYVGYFLPRGTPSELKDKRTARALPDMSGGAVCSTLT